MRVFWDVDTQFDFLDPKGALYVPESEGIRQNLERLTEYAMRQKIPVAGSVDRHFGTDEYAKRETELKRNGGGCPLHCMDGTFGQTKIGETNYNRDMVFHPNRLDGVVDEEMIRMYDNILFEKQEPNVFSNPAAETYLKEKGVDEAVVYGVATDICVGEAVVGLQERGVQCYVVEDAIKGLDQEGIDNTLERMKESNAKFLKTENIIRYDQEVKNGL